MKRSISILLAVVMAFSLILTSCQGKKSDGSNADGTSAPKERVKLKILFPAGDYPVPPDVDPQDNKWANVYKTAFPEVDFEFITTTAAGASEKKNLMIASGDVPDMMPVNQLEMIKFADQGIIQPLDEVVKKHYPNIMKFITPDDMKMAQYNGKQWGMPVPNNSLQNPERMFIRKDWLEKLNLKMPTTVDEFYNVMQAFTTKDPDGNGKNDTFGIGGQKNLASFAAVFAPFDVNQGFWSRINGKLVFDNIRPEMKEALGFIRKLYMEGIMDKDSIVQNLQQAEQKISQNKYGVFNVFSWGMNSRINQALAKSVTGGEYVSVPPIKGPTGAQWTIRQRNIWGNIQVVSATSKYPEYPAKILNWSIEEDKTKNYYTLNADKITCGELGVDAELFGKFIGPIGVGNLSEEGKKNLYRNNYRFMFASTNMLKDEDMILFAEEQVKSGMVHKNYPEDRRMVQKYGHYDDAIISGPVTAELLPQLNTYFDEIKMKIVTGALPLDAFDQWVDFYNKNGGPKIEEEINKNNPAK